jgi:tetratricopeptide (TPR) repeat protein
MVFVSTGTAVAAWAALPPEVQKAVAASAGKIFVSGTSSVLGRLKRRFLPSAEQKARQDALREAIGQVLAGHPTLQEVGLAEALGRPPFAAVILHAVEYPTKKIDVGTIHGAFANSVFDLKPIGVDEGTFVGQIQSAFLEALRLGSTSTGRELHAGVRVEQTATAVDNLHGKLDAFVANRQVAATDESVEALMQEAKVLHDRGATKGAIAIWERLLPRVLSENFSPTLRTRVLQNIATVRLNEGGHTSALLMLERALEYSPNSVSLLARKVDALLSADRLPEARALAADILANAPDTADAWIAHIRTSEQPVRVRDLPNGLQADASVLFVIGVTAAQSRRRGEAVEALRESVRVGPRVPAALLALAGALLDGLYPRRSGDAAPEEILSEVERLCREVTSELTTDDHATMRARAAYLLGEVSVLRGQAEDGSEFFQRAMELNTNDPGIRLAAVRSRIAAGKGEVAKYLLDAISPGERGPEWNGYRGAAALLTGSTVEVADCLREVVGAVDDEQRVQGAAILVEALLAEHDASYASQVEQLIEVMDHHVPEDVVHTYRARLALICNDQARAVAEYASALEASEGRVRDELSLEYASCFFRAGEFARAADLFASSGELGEHPVAQRQYAACLLRMKRWPELDALLDSQLRLTPVPTWALGCDVQTALGRNDLPRAERSLRQIAQQMPEDVGVAIQLADVLLRLGQRDAALAAVAPVRQRTDLDTANTVNLALVLLRAGEHLAAVSLAFRATRAAPDDEDVQRACLFGVAIPAETSGIELAPLYDRERAEPDTVVTMSDRHGRDHTITIFAEGPNDVTKQEFLASDPRVSSILGKAVGDSVMSLGAMSASEVYEVTGIESAVRFTFRNALQAFERRFPEQTVMRSVFVGEGEQFDPTELIEMLQQRDARTERIKALYRQQPVPIGLMADSLGRSLRRTYLELLADSTLRIEVDVPPFSSAGEAAAKKDTVVLTITGLATLNELGLLQLLTTQFTRLIAPRSLVDELAAELGEWDAVVERGEFSTASARDGRIAIQEATADDILRIRRSLAALQLFVTENAEVLPRPATQLAGADELLQLMGQSSFDSMMLSSPDSPMFADDLVLRALALEHRGEAGFATISLLREARTCDLIDPAAFRVAIARLREWRYSIVPASDTDLVEELTRADFQLTTSVLRMFDDAFHQSIDAGIRVATATAVLREVAVASATEATLVAVTTAIAERLTGGTDALTIAPDLLQSVSQAL